jgi:hypothetical protein
LPVPLGREVSGEQRGHCENMVEGVRPFATVPVQFESGYCDGPPADSQSLLVHPAGKTGVGSSARESAPWYFSCVRRGIDGFIADVDRVVDRETAEHQGVSE